MDTARCCSIIFCTLPGSPLSFDFRPSARRLVKRAVVARASPTVDFILFTLMTVGLSVAGHTFQNVYETRMLVESVRTAPAPLPALREATSKVY
jgi:hypothetical protein